MIIFIYIGSYSSPAAETVTRQELKSLIFSDETRTQFTEYIQSLITPRYDTLMSNNVEENSPAVNHRHLDHQHSRKRKLSTYVVETDDTWLCATISVPTLIRRYVGIARLKHSTNLGPTREGKNTKDVVFIRFKKK